jgi:hypothetical protein
MQRFSGGKPKLRRQHIKIYLHELRYEHGLNLSKYDRDNLRTVGNGAIISRTSQNSEMYLSRQGHIRFSKRSSSIDIYFGIPFVAIVKHLFQHSLHLHY